MLTERDLAMLMIVALSVALAAVIVAWVLDYRGKHRD